MNREQALDILSRCKPVLQERYGLTTLALFGSTARNDAREDSDIDILVGFDGKATSKQFFGVQFYLEEALGSPVDLVTEKAVREELKPYITQDRVDVFGYSNERGKVNG
ncbi:MAG: nucleotidyltransferase family protein [Thalassolituus sp.]